MMKALQEENELLKYVTRELTKASEFYLGFALVTSGGLKLVLPLIERCLRKGGRGQVLLGVDLPTDPEAIHSLMVLQTRHNDNFEMRLFQSGTRFFHPKISIFVKSNGAKVAIIGSSNLTAGGLGKNHEANVLLDEREVVESFQDYFEEHFQGAHARRVDEDWLNQYRQLWIHRKKAEQRQRQLREEARSLGGTPSKAPNKLTGHIFAFTGRIADWPRKRILYPRVERRGAQVAKSIGSAEYLVQAELLGGRKTTRKLIKARKLKIPIITEEQFLKLMGTKS